MRHGSSPSLPELTKRAGGTSNATLLLSPLGMKIGSVGRSNMRRRSFCCAGLDILKWMFCHCGQRRLTLQINKLQSNVKATFKHLLIL
jgi:hypothetical protein